MRQAKTIDNQKYAWDKPSDCAYCYFWKANKKCCSQKECYYLIPDDVPEAGTLQATEMSIPEEMGNCKTCAYGRNSPCIGYCIKKILLEMNKKKSMGSKDRNSVSAENYKTCQG